MDFEKWDEILQQPKYILPVQLNAGALLSIWDDSKHKCSQSPRKCTKCLDCETIKISVINSSCPHVSHMNSPPYVHCSNTLSSAFIIVDVGILYRNATQLFNYLLAKFSEIISQFNYFVTCRLYIVSKFKREHAQTTARVLLHKHLLENLKEQRSLGSNPIYSTRCEMQH